MGKMDSNKIGAMSRDVCAAIKNLSKKECEELNKYSQKQCTEISNMSKEVCKAIEQQAKVSKFDKWNMFFTVVGIICSVGAIIVAAFIPSRIAKEQNKIALFDKRYDLYCEFQAINDFLKGYSAIYGNEKEAILNEACYEALWEGEIHQKLYPDTENIGTVLRLQEQKVNSVNFIFDGITEEEMNLCVHFFNVYRTMTQNCVLLPNADAYILEGELDETYIIYDISGILEKMNEQLILNKRK